MKLSEYIKSHKVSTIALILIVVVGVGVQAWLYYGNVESATIDGFAYQKDIVRYESQQTINLEHEGEKQEELIEDEIEQKEEKIGNRSRQDY